jgi:hypothetical protein
LKNKLLYLVMPPGWSHTGDHKTARVIREEFLESTKDQPLNGDTGLEEVAVPVRGETNLG